MITTKNSIFRIGDRVKAIGKVDGKYLCGYVGTIRAIANYDSRFDVGVEFDRDIGGHNLSQAGQEYAENGHGRWGCDNEFMLIKTTSRSLPAINQKEFEKILFE